MREGKYLKQAAVVALICLRLVANGERLWAQQGTSPAPGTIFLYPERILLPNGEFVTAERGMIFVPANRRTGNMNVLGIEVYRFRAAQSAKPGTPPIFRLPGGPNFEGLAGSLSRPLYYEREIAPFLTVADLVIVGQRGIGTSKPATTCAPPAATSLIATTSDERAAANVEAARKCKAYWEQQGVDLAGLMVVEAAADVDVRKALGYPKIQLSGQSFGSHWSMAVMRFYPQIVERAVLSGMEGPDQSYDSPSGLLSSLAAIAADADTAAALRGFIPAGGLMQALREVIARLDKEPAMVTVADSTGKQQTVRVDGNAIREVAKGYAGGPAAWPANVIALYHGDYSGAARALINDRLSQRYPTASFFMLDCSSGISPARAASYKIDTAVAVVGDLSWLYNVNCPIWNADAGDAFRKNFRSTIPTVIVHGDHDLSTPLANALELHPFFVNSRLVVVHGGPHPALAIAMQRFPSFRAQILQFHATGEMSDLPKEIQLPAARWVRPEKRPASPP